MNASGDDEVGDDEGGQSQRRNDAAKIAWRKLIGGGAVKIADTQRRDGMVEDHKSTHDQVHKHSP